MTVGKKLVQIRKFAYCKNRNRNIKLVIVFLKEDMENVYRIKLMIHQ